MLTAVGLREISSLHVITFRAGQKHVRVPLSVQYHMNMYSKHRLISPLWASHFWAY